MVCVSFVYVGMCTSVFECGCVGKYGSGCKCASVYKCDNPTDLKI